MEQRTNEWPSAVMRMNFTRKDVALCPSCGRSFWDYRPCSIMTEPENEDGITKCIMPICQECFDLNDTEAIMSYCADLVNSWTWNAPWGVVEDTVRASIEEQKDGVV